MKDYGFGSSIPVIRMLCEKSARSFYLDFLGYEVDWEHRFQKDDPESPLCMQIRRGESVIHLDGHAEDDSPTAEVRIPITDLQGFEEELSKRCEDREKPKAVDPRYEWKNTDMNIYDPSGNLLVFWLRDTSS